MASESEFLERLSDVLETSVTLETRFRDVDNWSSLMGFGILVTLKIFINIINIFF